MIFLLVSALVGCNGIFSAVGMSKDTISIPSNLQPLYTLLWAFSATAIRRAPLAFSMDKTPAVLPSVRIKLAAEPSISEMSFSASLITPFGQERLSE